MPLKLSLGISNPSDASGCRLPHAMVIHRNATFFSLVECLILAMTSGQDVCGPTTFKGTPGINLQQIRLPGWVFVFFSCGPTFAAPVIVALCLSKPAWHLLAPLSYAWENSAKIGIGLWTFFTKREEVQLAATSKDKQLAMSMVCIFCAFGFEIGSSKFATGRHLLLMNIAHCLGACPVPWQCQDYSLGHPMRSRLVMSTFWLW